MSSAVADLETSLQAMLALKPPGVSGSRISTVTSLCMANVQVRTARKGPHYLQYPGPNPASQLIANCLPAVSSSSTRFRTDHIRLQSESVLIQKIFTHFRKAPANYKLGVLYVVDSVTRKWLEQAKQQGQPVSNAAPDGTPAAGVNRVTELMPILMDDIVSSAPQDQKVRPSSSLHLNLLL